MGLAVILAGSLAFFLPLRKQAVQKDLGTLEKDCPLIARSDHVSKMIEQGDLTMALDESLRIEEMLKNQESFPLVQPGAITRILNTKRIAELYHALGLFQEEAEAWASLEALLASDKAIHREAFSHIENDLREENLDLKSFIASRKKEALSKH
jgi:hypothetical protein